MSFVFFIFFYFFYVAPVKLLCVKIDEKLSWTIREQELNPNNEESYEPRHSFDSNILFLARSSTFPMRNLFPIHRVQLLPSILLLEQITVHLCEWLFVQNVSRLQDWLYVINTLRRFDECEKKISPNEANLYFAASGKYRKDVNKSIN